jgi:site-specific recombinase XerD
MTPLRKRMIEELQLRNLSEQTIHAYVKAVERFAKHFNASPERLGPEQIRQYLVYLIHERGNSANTLQVQRAALHFLYVKTLKRPWFDEEIARAKRIPKLPGRHRGSRGSRHPEPNHVSQALDHPRHLVRHRAPRR